MVQGGALLVEGGNKNTQTYGRKVVRDTRKNGERNTGKRTEIEADGELGRFLSGIFAKSANVENPPLDITSFLDQKAAQMMPQILSRFVRFITAFLKRSTTSSSTRSLALTQTIENPTW